MIWEILRDIFFNQFLFPLQLLVATLIFTYDKRRRKAFKRKLFVGFLLFVLVNALVAWFPPYVNLFIKFAAVISYVYFCYDVGYGQAVFDSTCAYATQHLAYQLSMVLCGLLHLRVWGQLTVQCIIFIAVYIAAYFWFVKKIREFDEIMTVTTDNIIAMTAMLLVAIVLTVFTSTLPPANVISGFQSSLPAEETIVVLTLHCALYSAACCVFILWIQINTRKHLKLQHELDVQRQLWLSHKSQYEMSKENIAIINQKCHDLKHQIAALRDFYSEEQRREYLEKIEKSIMIYDSTIKTGNEILDTILTEKKLLCEKNQIELTCVADGECLSFIDPIDLYAIITNALNNAIDYVTQLEDPNQRIIAVMVYSRANLAFIQIENYFPGTLEYREGLPETTKADKNIHGYGLKSICYSVEKYSGYLNIDTKNDMFILRISLPTVQ